MMRCGTNHQTNSPAGQAGRGLFGRRLARFRHAAILFLLFTGIEGRSAKAWPFPVPDGEIARYTAFRSAGNIVVDGKLDEPAWRQVPRTPRFVDLISGAETIRKTQTAVMWDNEYLYVGFWVEEPVVRARFTKRDSPIYEENDVEFFIAGKDAYYEFEINATNTIYEVFFIWEEAYERGGFDEEPLFRRSGEADVRGFGGVGFRNHPRGARRGSWSWDFPGLKTAVFVDGTLNKDDDRDRGWTVELAFPWEGMKWLAKADGRALPPRDGDVWRMNMMRFNRYKEAPPAGDSGGWAWSRHGVWDSHIPECFPYVTFTRRSVAE